LNTEPEDQEFDPFATELDKPKGGGHGVAWIALLLALVVAAYTGWQWWLDSRRADQDAALQASVVELRNELNSLERRQGALDGRVDAAERKDDGAALRELRRQLADLGAGLETLDARLTLAEQAEAGSLERIAGLESGFSAVLAREQSPTRVLELDEVDHLLRVASERARLFADPESANAALALADAQLQAIDDPLYIPVRQAIANARQELAGLDIADTVALNEQLAAVQRSLLALPFPGDEPVAATAGEEASQPGIWARFKATVAGLVTVRRTTDDTALGLADRDALRQALWLQLETARLAVMRRDATMYGAALDRAEQTLDEHFDTGSRAVREAGAELEVLSRASIAPELPDLSAPWTRLQRLRVTATAIPAPVTESGDNASSTAAGAEAAPVTEGDPEP